MLVRWEIDVDESLDAVDAAREAFRHMQRPGTSAVVFDVFAEDGTITRIDLLDLCSECDNAMAEQWGMCASCVHDALRSGWVPGEKAGNE